MFHALMTRFARSFLQKQFQVPQVPVCGLNLQDRVLFRVVLWTTFVVLFIFGYCFFFQTCWDIKMTGVALSRGLSFFQHCIYFLKMGIAALIPDIPYQVDMAKRRVQEHDRANHIMFSCKFLL